MGAQLVDQPVTIELPLGDWLLIAGWITAHGPTYPSQMGRLLEAIVKWDGA